MAISRYVITTPTLRQWGFGLLVLLLVSMGGFSFLKASDAGKAFGDAVDNRYRKISALQALHDRVAESGRMQRDLLLLTDADGIRSAAQAMAALQKGNTALLSTLEPTFTSDKERALFKAISDGQTQYLAASQRFMGPASSGAQELAGMLLQTDMAPTEQTYLAALAAMRTFQEAQMQSANADTAAGIRQIQTTWVLAGVCGLLVAIGYFSKPLKPEERRLVARPQQQAAARPSKATEQAAPPLKAKVAVAGGKEEWEAF